jgi:hypothetical protein
MKTCSKCFKKKPNEFFGLKSARCKECDSEYQRKYRELHKEKLKEQKKNYYIDNRNILIEKSQNWYYNNKERKNNYDKERNIKNKEINSKLSKIRYEENKDYIKEKNKKHITIKYKTDDNFRLKMNLRHRLRTAFKRYSKNGKVGSSKDYNIDWQKIIEHIGPCPGNRSFYNIDHIIPLCAFNFDDPLHVEAAFAPENHRWLEKTENLSKNGKYDVEEFRKYINEKNRD